MVYFLSALLVNESHDLMLFYIVFLLVCTFILLFMLEADEIVNTMAIVKVSR